MDNTSFVRLLIGLYIILVTTFVFATIGDSIIKVLKMIKKG